MSPHSRRLCDPQDPVWVGDWSLPADQQGLNVLGSPLGHEAYVQRRIRLKRAEHDRIPQLGDLQAAWLLLHYCAATRANYLLRVLPPHLTEEYASSHDDAVASCLSSLLDLGEAPLPQPSLRAAQLAWRHGGLGLRSARADRHTAHWASWCDTLPVIHARAPAVAGWLLSALDGQQPLPSAAAAAQSLQRVRANGYDAPAWASVLRPDSAPRARRA